MDKHQEQIQADTQELVEQWGNCFGAYEASLVVHRVGFACYGSPTEEKDGKCGYEEEQQKHIQRVTDIILDGRTTGNIMMVEVIVYYYLASDKSLRSMFVFLYQNATGKQLYTDFSERTYATWQDWINWNTLPASELRFPKNGRYPAKGTKIEIAIGHSPAACIGHKTVVVADTTALIGGLGLAVIGIGCFFFPPAAAAVPFIVGGELTVAGYSVVRSTSGLVDRAKHGQSCSLYNSEARGMWLGIGLSLVAGGAGIAVKNTKKLLDAGKAISATRAAITNTLNVSRLSLSAIQIIDRSVHLISNPDKVTPLGVFQVAVAVFFFTRSMQEFQLVAATPATSASTSAASVSAQATPQKTPPQARAEAQQKANVDAARQAAPQAKSDTPPAASASTPATSESATPQTPSPAQARAEAHAKFDARQTAAAQAKSDMSKGLPQRDIPKAAPLSNTPPLTAVDEAYLAARLASHEKRWADPGLKHQIGIKTRLYKHEADKQEILNKKMACSDNPGEIKKVAQKKIDSVNEEKRLREETMVLLPPDHPDAASHRQRIDQFEAELKRLKRIIEQSNHSSMAVFRELMK